MTSLVQTALNKSLRANTLSDLVRVRTAGLPMLLIDTSGSMDDILADGKTRINATRDTVRELTKGGETPVKMIGFGGYEAQVITSIPNACGGTPLASAIDLAKQQGASHVIVISDGMPNDQRGALESAARFGGKIDVIFIGNKGEPGEQFLKQLSESTGGTEFHGDLTAPKELADKIAGLLGSGEDDEETPRGAIQL